MRGVSVVYSIKGRDGNNTRSRSISCERGWPDSRGSTTASSTGRPRMLASTSSQVDACATLNREPAARRSLWNCTSGTAASTSINSSLARSPAQQGEGIGYHAQLGGMNDGLGRQLWFARLLAPFQPR